MLAKRRDHITPILKDLHWLPIKYRIQYKVLLITFKALNGTAPHYISELICSYTPSRCLRSSSQNLLTVPPARTKTLGERGGKGFCTRCTKTLELSTRLPQMPNDNWSIQKESKNSLVQYCLSMIICFSIIFQYFQYMFVFLYLYNICIYMYVYLYMYFMCVKRIGILYKSEMRSIKASYYYYYYYYCRL